VQGLVLVLTLMLAGCTTVDVVRQKLLPIESRLRLQLHEELTTSGRQLMLLVVTDNTYPCMSYQVAYRMTRAGAGIGIVITGVKPSDPCAQQPGSATARIDLGAVDGPVPVRITVNDNVVDGELFASADSYVLTGLDGPWTYVTRTTLMRVPPNTLWGHVGYHDINHASVVAAYLDSLQSLGASPVTLQPGDYEYFSIDSLGNIQSPPYGYPFMNSHTLHYTGPHEALPGVLEAFRDSLYLELHTDLGESFYGWVPIPLDQ
jgi:hypothetical protein